ncbi:alpha/beta hydrolase [Sporosarcina sp. ACRSL]|uniref:alpha/beta fold hydrolase n=1 Tax=Sporosarcina sp. ACRSL TaxID=2918215 RepID=UPI001EF6A86D|nr:alpha/beta hydrolase [Sporosarcina sp. ACRSL]MCG7343552.1 alpha/beta hydrolase [Sporosarcina sp. ACRSL]
MSKIRQIIVVNNKKLEIQQKGSCGIPILILTGMGNSLDEWHEITEELSKRNKVIMFHRPGLGISEIGDESRTTLATANELKGLLFQLNIVEPIILVGHSYGGLCAQHFAKLYPSHLRGMVLVDSTSIDFKILEELKLPALNEDSTDEAWLEKCYLYSSMNKDELSKIIPPSLTKRQKQFPLNVQERLMDFQVNPTLYKAMYSEIKNWISDAEIIKGLGDFPDVPLVVIGRDKEYCIKLGTDEGFPEWELRIYEEKWQELIKDQANLSSNSKLIFAEQSGHLIYLDRPDVLIQAITEISLEAD